MPTITPPALRELLESSTDVRLIDVREPQEFDAGHLDGARNVPLERLAAVLPTLGGNAAVVFYCRSGQRSAQAASFARSVGVSGARTLEGGLIAWRKAR